MVGHCSYVVHAIQVLIEEPVSTPRANIFPNYLHVESTYLIMLICFIVFHQSIQFLFENIILENVALLYQIIFVRIYNVLVL